MVENLSRRVSRLRRAAGVAVAVALFGQVYAPAGSAAAPQATHAATPASLGLVEQGDGSVVAVLRDGDGLRVATYAAPAGTADNDMIEQLAAMRDVVVAEPAGAWAPADAIPAAGFDPRRSQQWHLDEIGAPAIWNRDGAEIIVAVLDTGMLPHPELAGLLLSGVDFTGSAPDDDPDYHATFVAGMVTALHENGSGISATVPNLRILPGTVCAPLCQWADVAAGIIWATDRGADVVNLSLSGSSPSAVVDAAIAYARGNGVVVVAAAGNDGDKGNPRKYPAATPGVIAVGATKQGGLATDWASFGDWVDLAAPGESVFSLYNAVSYASGNGTSFAAPQVSAAAAIARAIDPTLTPDEIASLLKSTAVDVNSPGWDSQTGAGLLNLPAFVTAVEAKAPRAPLHRPGVVGPGGPVLIDTTTGNPVPVYTGAPNPERLVAVAQRQDGRGTWAVDPEGVMYTTGVVAHLGDMRGVPLTRPVLGMTPTASAAGYWMVASDGGVFAFGDAAFYGSMGGTPLFRPVTGMAVTGSGNGYWMVASDGGIFAFGDARFHGSMGGTALVKPVNGMAVTPSGNGYWMVASDGGIFAFGDAGFYGSLGGRPLEHPVIGMITSPTGLGYWLVDAAGRSYPFGDAT